MSLPFLMRRFTSDDHLGGAKSRTAMSLFNIDLPQSRSGPPIIPQIEHNICPDIRPLCLASSRSASLARKNYANSSFLLNGIAPDLVWTGSEQTL